MAVDSRTYDVWITERNMVYRGVPFTVVGDWIMEGRLLEGDRVRPSGGSTWQRLAEDPLLAPYLPKPEPARVEDQAEALERLDVDFNVKKPEEAEDDDVDMIPLIDISMVLLVFFMMTANDLLTASPVSNPKAVHAEAIEKRGSVSVGIKLDPSGKNVEYYFNDNYNEVLNEFQLHEKIRAALAQPNPPKRVIMNAEGKMPFDKVQQLTLDLEKLGAPVIQGKVTLQGGGGGPAEQVQ